MSRSSRVVTVCSIGCTDPTGAAGLFLDAAVYARLGTSGTFVVAGVSAQNSAAVFGVQALAPSTIRLQLQATWKQVQPDAVRIGLMPSAQAARTVARFLRGLRERPAIVVDPVLGASSGHRLARRGTAAALLELMRIATIATPNAMEAEELTGMAVRTVADAERAARALSQRTGCAVVVTGGHLRGPRGSLTDILARGNRIARYRAKRLRASVRGTGCMLAAALAVWLARGSSPGAALVHARAFVRREIARARPLGRGKPQLRAGR